MRLLLVDDEVMILKALARALRAQDLFLAEGYDQAVEILKSEEDLDMVVSDCQMPGPSGVEVFRAALQHQPEARRVMLSGNPPAELTQLLDEGLIHKFIHKPFDFVKGSLLEALTTD